MAARMAMQAARHQHIRRYRSRYTFRWIFRRAATAGSRTTSGRLTAIATSHQKRSFGQDTPDPGRWQSVSAEPGPYIRKGFRQLQRCRAIAGPYEELLLPLVI